jgi:hypothetical protein
VDIEPLTEAEISHLCKLVTPAQRDFCGAHMNWREWPEIWLRDHVSKDRGADMTKAPPYTETQWWGFINDRVVTPGEPSSDAAQ